MKNIVQPQKTTALHLSYDESIDWHEFRIAERSALVELQNMVDLLGDPRNRVLMEELKRRQHFIQQFD